MNGFGAKRVVAPGWGAPPPLKTGILGENTVSTDQRSSVGEQHKVEEPKAMESETSVDTNKVSAPTGEAIPVDRVRKDESDRDHDKNEEVESTDDPGPNVGEAVREVLDVFLREQVQPLLVEVSKKQAAVEASFETVTSLANEVSKLGHQVSILGAGLRTLSSDVREHKATEVDTLTQALAKSEKDKESLRAQLDGTKSKLAEASHKSAERKTQIETMYAQVQQLQAKVDDLESQQVQSVSSMSSAEVERTNRPSEEEARERRRRHRDRDQRADDRHRREGERRRRRASRQPPESSGLKCESSDSGSESSVTLDAWDDALIEGHRDEQREETEQGEEFEWKSAGGISITHVKW
ncbi:hypothetical protein FBEOM_12202 [Fusarium beomiforme]|uniref:Uncharacterized protein n=1 Tax=Fusarium beomiforme TaxID=44412 RepID=A0A9P5A822_9HYPO|nr:hypothetical protein FBEOM_12202 [Fusarium beomiforme]